MTYQPRLVFLAALASLLLAGCASPGPRQEGEGTGPGGLKSLGFSWGPSGNVDFGEAEGVSPAMVVPPLPTPTWYEFGMRGGYGAPPLSQTTTVTVTPNPKAPVTLAPQPWSTPGSGGEIPPEPSVDGINRNINR